MALPRHPRNQQSPRTGLRSSQCISDVTTGPAGSCRESLVISQGSLLCECADQQNLQSLVFLHSTSSQKWQKSQWELLRREDLLWICFDAVDVSWLITFDCFWQPPFPLHHSGQQSSILVETWTNLTYFCSCCYFDEQFIPGSFHHHFSSSSCLLTSLGMISLDQLQAHSSQYPSFFYRSLRCSSFSCL